ncbi:hypothetical protein BsWGS_26434 [Bradybaena similaris]
MEKLWRLPLGLCSSCLASRNMLSLCLRQPAACFSTSTQLMKSPRCRESVFVSGTQAGQPRSVRDLSMILRHNNTDLTGCRRYSFTSDRTFCKKLSNFSLPTMSSSYQTYFITKYTVRLLRLSTRVNSTHFYSTHTPTPDPQKPPSQNSQLSPATGLISWKSVLLLAGVGVLIVMGVQYLKTNKELEIKKARNRTLGKAKLGGDWTLTDHHGNRRSSTDFRGQWLLIYFGFTHCPDVCPEELEKIVGVIKKTDANEKLPKIQPIVITVDPERDTPQALKEYCSEFSPRLLGFTGSPEEIHQATHAYRVYFSAGPKDDDNDYIVDHSIISYLVDPEGQFAEYFGQNKTVDNIYNSILFHIGLYNKNKQSG